MEVSRTVVITEFQYLQLEAELLDAGAERQSPTPEEPQQAEKQGNRFTKLFYPASSSSTKQSSPPEQVEQPIQMTFYDNEGLALTLRGWWLSHTGAAPGDWMLQVPVYKPVPGANPEMAVVFAKHEELTAPEEILDRLGLAAHAELYRAGKQTNFEGLLREAGVVMCASMSSKRSTFCASLQEEKIFPAADDDGSNLSITLDHLKFGVKTAEHQAVANLLFEMGNAAPSALKPAVARFTLKAPPGTAPSEEALSKLRLDLAKVIRSRGLAAVTPSKETHPAFWANLATLRPAHLRALYKGNVFATPKRLEDPQDGDIDTQAAVGAGYSADAVPVLAEVD